MPITAAHSTNPRGVPEMKGIPYGGVLYLPEHPSADIHGLVRAVIRTKSWLWAEEHLTKQTNVLRTHHLWTSGFWSESKSAVEILVSQQHYGELLICPMVESYINAEAYKPYRKQAEKVHAEPAPISGIVKLQA